MGVLAFILFFLLICVLYSSVENQRKLNEFYYEQINDSINKINETIKQILEI